MEADRNEMRTRRYKKNELEILEMKTLIDQLSHNPGDLFNFFLFNAMWGKKDVGKEK